MLYYFNQSFSIMTLGCFCVPACADNCDYCEAAGSCNNCLESYRMNMDTGQCVVGVLRYKLK